MPSLHDAAIRGEQCFVIRPAGLVQIALTFPPHTGAMFLSLALYALEGASMNCSEDSDFCTGTESLFFNLMQQRSDSFTVG